MHSPQVLEQNVRPASPASVPGPVVKGGQVSAWMSVAGAPVTPTTAIPDAYDLMVQRRIHHLPVVTGDRVVGLITRAALRAALPQPALLHSDRALLAGMRQLQVRLVMAPDPPTVTPSTAMHSAAALMLAHDVDAVLVVGPAGALVGILTMTDLCRMVAAG